MLVLKVGQEIDGRTIDKITMDKETRAMTVCFGEDYPDDNGLVVKQNESINKILNHKWKEYSK